MIKMKHIWKSIYACPSRDSGSPISIYLMWVANIQQWSQIIVKFHGTFIGFSKAIEGFITLTFLHNRLWLQISYIQLKNSPAVYKAQCKTPSMSLLGGLGLCSEIESDAFWDTKNAGFEKSAIREILLAVHAICRHRLNHAALEVKQARNSNNRKCYATPQQ